MAKNTWRSCIESGINMSKRIKELIEQSITIEEYGWGASYENFDREKFAELIVQDCYQRLLDMDQQVKGSHNYYKHAAIQIKLHFGVE